MWIIYDGDYEFKRRYHNGGTPRLMEWYYTLAQPDAIDTRIITWDGPGAKDTRKEIFPGYKANREKNKDAEFDRAMYDVMKWFKELVSHTHALQITVPGAEGDDVIAALVNDTKEQCKIVTGDKDMLALVDNARVFCETPIPEDIQSNHDVRLYKALVGDASDNIPGLKGFGPKAWAKLDRNTRAILHRWFDDSDYFTDEEIAKYLTLGKKASEEFAERAKEIRTYWKIIGFMPVTAKQIQDGIVVPDRDTVKAGQMLQEIGMGM